MTRIGWPGQHIFVGCQCLFECGGLDDGYCVRTTLITSPPGPRPPSLPPSLTFPVMQAQPPGSGGGGGFRGGGGRGGGGYGGGGYGGGGA